MQNEKKNLNRVVQETKPEDHSKKYILRKRQEFEATREMREFFDKASTVLFERMEHEQEQTNKHGD